MPNGFSGNRDKKTLYLVRTDVHDSSPHTGGHSLKLQELDNETKSVKTTKKNKKDSKQGKSSTKGCGGKGRTMK